MSYQVIARKWRPACFSEVVGQSHVVKTLQNAIESGRIAHAYILSGPRGVGKTTVARIFARALNCQKGPAIEPCNECALCKEIASGYSTDVLEIDGASNTHVENIRELTESVKYSPSRGRYRVYIIDEVHMLTSHAFNALLKTLEEPPPHVIFLFATTEPHKIPATIHSRCQRFEFRRIPMATIADKLKEIAGAEGIKVEDEALYILARESEGSLRDAQSMLDQVIAFSGKEIGAKDVRDVFGLMDRGVIEELLRCMVHGDGAGCLNVVEKINEFGYDLKKLLAELIEYVRDLIVIKVCGDRRLVELSEAEFDHLRELSGRIELGRADLLFSILSRGYEELARSSTPRFSLEMTLLRACNLEELKDVSELLEALRGAASGAGAVRRAAAPATNPPTEKGGSKAMDGSEPAEPAPQEEAPQERGFIEYIFKKDRALKDAIGDATVRVEEGRLFIEVPKRHYHFVAFIKKAELETLAKEYFKKPLRLEVKEGGGSPQHEAVATQTEEITKRVANILGAQIIEERSIDDA